jgi:hypothetical protein
VLRFRFNPTRSAPVRNQLLDKRPARLKLARRFLHRDKLDVRIGSLLAITLLLICAQTANSDVTVRIDRWLAVRQLMGTVTYFQAKESRSARQGDRLQNVGDGVTTATAASARLELDTQIGTVEVAEDTQMSIQTLDITPSDGRITRLRVDWGRVRLQIRTFTNPDSRLEIETPAGVSGVRGTDFGLVVQPDGTMGVATLEGSVVTEAQTQTVEVPGGFQNITIPGEPPSAPVPFTNEPRLDYQIERTIRRGVRRVRVAGQVDPTSTVLYKGEPQTLDRDGKFSLLLPARSRLKIQIIVITALGRAQTYDLDLI